MELHWYIVGFGHWGKSSASEEINLANAPSIQEIDESWHQWQKQSNVELNKSERRQGERRISPTRNIEHNQKHKHNQKNLSTTTTLLETRSVAKILFSSTHRETLICPWQNNIKHFSVICSKHNCWLLQNVLHFLNYITEISLKKFA